MTERYALLALLAVAPLAAQDCNPAPDPPPEPPDARFCSGVGTGVLASTVRGVKGEIMSIIGGFEAENYYSTVQVMIQNHAGEGWGWCSGTVISPHTVLMAGHCKSEESIYKVYQDRLRDARTYFVPSSDLQHPGYDRWDSTYCRINQDTGLPCTGTNAEGCYTVRCPPHDDLLLLFFEQELPWPAVDGIYDPETDSEGCDDLIAQGWGATSRAGVTPPPGHEYVDCADGLDFCLQQAPIEVIRNRPTDYDLWVRGWGNICFGDSGGPTYALMDDGRVLLVGVTSTVSATNCVGTDAVRAHGTSVKAIDYEDWIEEHTRI
jgi:hypothetical protein